MVNFNLGNRKILKISVFVLGAFFVAGIVYGTSTIGTNITTTGTMHVGGSGAVTVFEAQGTASASYLLTGNTLQVGGFASAAYSRFGTSTTGHSNYISSANDVLVSGDLEVRGTVSFGGVASVSGRVFLTGLTSLTDDRSVCASSSTGELELVDGACGTSSIRFKENIRPLNYGLDDLIKLNPVIFNYKDSADSSRLPDRIGLIAEEVNEVIPEVIKFGSDGLPEGIDYPNLVAVNIKTIKELNLKVDRLWSAMIDSVLSLLSDGTLAIIRATDGIFTNIKTERIEIRDGITIYDSVNSQPVCIRSVNNVLALTAGACN
ncbi:MAG: tail fiber domain-containing protein [Candidatus Yanofskybacteria bacterium]|nr:tail fiber domain-containing protein [Candidatus Yanofskybacteria bacterium]